MKPKTVVLLAVALSCGLVAMLGVQQAMQGSQGPVKVKTERVLVALQNIESGIRLNSENVGFKEMPSDSLPEDPVRTEEEYEERAAQVPLLPGDIVRLSKLTAKGGYGKSMTIPPGMRVITISVNDTHTASGLLKPGDRVDVLVTFRARNQRGAPISKTKTLLEYVEIFATDDQTASKLKDQKDSVHTKNVSLLLTPVQVNYVKLAESKGTLSLSWRHRFDDELVQTKDIDDKLLEELEGTAGGQGQFGLYGEAVTEAFIDRESEHERKREPAAAAAAEFLDSVEEPASATPPSPAARTTWTMFVYNGNQAMAQEFEIAATPDVPDPTEIPKAPTGGLRETLLSLWKAGGLNAMQSLRESSGKEAVEQSAVPADPSGDLEELELDEPDLAPLRLDQLQIEN